MEKPNILLIMVDEMRADCMGIAGHPDVKTPYIDTLASQGARFTNAYTACPSCVPARAALFSGLSQKNHKRTGYTDRVNWNYEHTLAGELTKNNYQTQCIGKMHVHPLRSLQGFMNVELHDGYLHTYRNNNVPYYEHQNVADDYMVFLKNELRNSADIIDTGLECNSWVARPWIYEERLHPTNWVTDRSIDFLRRRDRDKPFFLMASYVRPHAPYDAPQAYFDMYKDKALRPPFIGDHSDYEMLKQQGRIFNNFTGPIDDDLIKSQQIGYYACITHIDHQIGKLIQAMTDDVINNTIIMFVSDHGEMLSDHCCSRKSLPYQGSINIPFIIKGNGVNSGEYNQLVELRDVMPTLLKIAGNEKEIKTDGVDVLEFIKSNKATREYIHGEHTHGSLSSQFIVTEKDKYIWFSQTGIEQYFNLVEDPNEMRNIASNENYKERISYLREKLIKELEGRPEGYTDGKSLIVGRPTRNVL